MSRRDQSGGSVWARFDWSRERYEEFIRLVVPDYQEQESLIARVVREASPAEGEGLFRIIDLGAGTGTLSHHLLETFPQAELTAVDVSPLMLEACGDRLASFESRVHLRLADLGTLELDRGYHAAVSRLAIHHLDDGEKRALFSRLHEALLPGGVLAMSDLVSGSTPAQAEAMLEEWRGYMLARGEDPGEYEPLLVGEDDFPSPARDQVEWLVKAGFAQARVVWRRANVAVLCATKAV